MSTAPDRTGTLVTGEELFEMGDIGPCELIDGRIVPKSPTRLRHGQIQVLGDPELGRPRARKLP